MGTTTRQFTTEALESRGLFGVQGEGHSQGQGANEGRRPPGGSEGVPAGQVRASRVRVRQEVHQVRDFLAGRRLCQRGGPSERVRLPPPSVCFGAEGRGRRQGPRLRPGKHQQSKSGDGTAELLGECEALVAKLRAQHESFATALDHGFPLLRGSLWYSPQQVASAGQVLAPPMKENLKKIQSLLQEAL